MSAWRFAGVLLDTYGVVSRVSDALKLPERRGDNAMVPLRDGRVFVRKQFDQRKITLGLEIVEKNVTDLESKMDTLRALFGTRSQAALQETLENGAVRSSLAEVSGDLGVNRISPGCARLAVDFILAGTYFRSTTLVSDEKTIDESLESYTLSNPGTAEERDMVITFTGPLTYPRVTNVTNNTWVAYNGEIPAGVTVVIDCADFTATSLGYNVIGYIVHSGDVAFLVLQPGSNSLQVTASVAGGKVKIEFYPPYF
jgi:phage-related protein